MIKTLAIRGLWMLLGYSLAVLVATTVVCILLGAPTVLPDNGAMGSFYGYLKGFPMMFVFGAMMTAMFGLPGWLISVIAAEIRAAQGRLWFALAGMLTSALAIVLANGVGADWLSFTILIGGFCGGLAYWAITGKTSGNWKTHS